MVSPNPTPEPREAVRDRIAGVFAEFMHQEGAAQRPVDFADKVMELFPDLMVEDLWVTPRGGWVLPATAVGDRSHRRYVLRTSPEPTAAPAVRPDTAAAEPSDTPDHPARFWWHHDDASPTDNTGFVCAPTVGSADKPQPCVGCGCMTAVEWRRGDPITEEEL